MEQWEYFYSLFVFLSDELESVTQPSLVLTAVLYYLSSSVPKNSQTLSQSCLLIRRYRINHTSVMLRTSYSSILHTFFLLSWESTPLSRLRLSSLKINRTNCWSINNRSRSWQVRAHFAWFNTNSTASMLGYIGSDALSYCLLQKQAIPGIDTTFNHRSSLL